MPYFDNYQIDFDMDSRWRCTCILMCLHFTLVWVDGRCYGHVIKKFFTSSAAILNIGHSITSLQFNVRMWWMLFSVTTTRWFQFVEPNLKYTVPGKILPELFYSCTCYEDLPSLSAAAPCSSSWLIHRQCSSKKNSDRGRIRNHNHSNVYYNKVGLLQDHPKKVFTTKWQDDCDTIVITMNRHGGVNFMSTFPLRAPLVLISRLLLYMCGRYIASFHLDFLEEWMECKECNLVSHVRTFQ